MEFEDMLDVGATTNKEVGKLSKRKVGVLTKASMNEVVDASAATGGLTEGKRRGRKPRKQNEKEIMNEYMSEQEKHSAPTTAAGLRKYYENYQHMSYNEREQFDQKFTKPKTNSQEIYCSMLRAKSKKIILATGPAGTGKPYLQPSSASEII
jgi:phosphate starvation-inducible protein PhoH